MGLLPHSQDAVVIGGGFYGVVIAIYLARQRGMPQVTLVERGPALLTRASYNNQARVHNGYHYPRSFTTAYRSRVNLPRFVRDWDGAVVRDFTKIYGIARRNSKVTARQFERFCQTIGAPVQRAGASVRALFEPQFIEEVFEVEEYAFDASRLAQWAERELRESGVQVVLNTAVTAIARGPQQRLLLTAIAGDGEAAQSACRHVFNCSYSGLNQFGGDFPGTQTALKHEITEIALVQVPPALRGLGITVMDGPFFSLMPFPARGLHTLSHVRYTPHLHWSDQTGLDPHRKLTDYDRASRYDRMLRDVLRYIPAMQHTHYVESLFEVKTILTKNEGDDGRPILFERHAHLPGCYSILGGKIDNVYDAIDRLEREDLGA